MYFAHHHGRYIRLAYADTPEGPWHIYEPGTLHLDQVERFEGHIASPDVHSDDENQRIVMYFHGPTRDGPGQGTAVAFSTNGIDFEPEDRTLGLPYFRVFRWNGALYAAAEGRGGVGAICEGEDWAGPFHLEREIKGVGMRHGAVLVRGNTLYWFYSRRGDAPERIFMLEVQLERESRDQGIPTPCEVMRPEAAYEGAELGIRPSKSGRAFQPVHQLRDPAIFEEDGKVYLYYSIAGEQGVAGAEIRSCALQGSC
jgi:hypothetical protein